jgi:hypothetical protein
MDSFTDEELANAARKLLDGTWRVKGQEIDTEVDIIETFEIWEGDEKLADEPYFNKAMAVAMGHTR